MKYKKGDRVRIVSYRTTDMDSSRRMDKYLGMVITIKDIRHRPAISETSCYYEMVEDGGAWYWNDDMIAGLASETPFDFNAWKGKDVCMHCKTSEEAEDFCNEMHKAGLKWRTGISYLEIGCSNCYKGSMCYFFNEGVYDSFGYAKDSCYRILEWLDYRSTEPPKEEQEKTVEIKADDKPLGYQEAIKIYKKICNNTAECINCPLTSDNNGTQIPCQDFLRNYPEKAEPILKKWLIEHPIKTNEDKVNEMFLEMFGISYATALTHPDWLQQEYKNIDNEMQKRNVKGE
mgnify:FL=1